MTPERHNFTIVRGTTFSPEMFYLQPTFVKTPITAISKSGQAIVTAIAHGINLARQWGFIVGVAGMSQINSRDIDTFEDAYQLDVLDFNSVEVNVNSTRFNDYISGGELLYHPPFDFTGYQASMRFKDPDNVELLLLTTAGGGIASLDATGTLAPVITAAATAALTWDEAAYDFWVTDPAGVVTPIFYGGVCVKVFNEPGCC